MKILILLLLLGCKAEIYCFEKNRKKKTISTNFYILTPFTKQLFVSVNKETLLFTCDMIYIKPKKSNEEYCEVLNINKKQDCYEYYKNMN